MINDKTSGSMIDYVMSVVDDPKLVSIVTASKKNAIISYNSNRDYLNECNKDLHNILKTNK